MAAPAQLPASARESRRPPGRWERSASPLREGRITRRKLITAYAFMAPSLIVLAVFVIWPMLSALRISLHDWSLSGDSTFVGLDNYALLVSDPQFHNALYKTLYYTAVTTPISVGLALALAILLNRKIPGRGFFRSALFLPAVTSLAVVAIAWSFLLQPDIGLLNHWLGAIGLRSGRWLSDPDWAMPAVILVGVWRNVGFYMVMYLAGLQSIPREIYEAADVDGVSRWQRFRHITWPLLANTTMFVFIVALIATLQAFDQIFVMTGGGPFFQTETLVMMLFRIGFSQFDFGYASAISYVLLLFIFVLSMGQLWYFRKRQVIY